MTASPEPRRMPTALAASAITEGAVITWDGDSLITTGESIVEAVEALLAQGHGVGEQQDRWLLPGIPLLRRGAIGIVPLSWAPTTPNDERSAAELDSRESELWSAVGSICWHLHGNQIAVDLPGGGGELRPYGAELARTGARRADWWSSGDWALVRIVYGDPIPAPVRAIALQIVPMDWVWSARRYPKAAAPTDLSWSWSDVVAFADATRAPGSVEGPQAEEHDA